MPNVKIINKPMSTIDGINILCLGDGFSDSDEKLFFDCVEEFALWFFKQVKPFDLEGEVNGAYKKVSDYFNIFAAFTPTPKQQGNPSNNESGISSAWPINNNGELVRPNDPSQIGYLEEKKSRFGLQYDDGGFSEKPGDEYSISNFISSLTLPISEVHGTAIPDCWNATDKPDVSHPFRGKDKGLVIVFVNDDTLL